MQRLRVVRNFIVGKVKEKDERERFRKKKTTALVFSLKKCRDKEYDQQVAERAAARFGSNLRYEAFLAALTQESELEALNA